ncbi:hypothetical protein ACFX11_042258 [Malus domestica]
MLFIKFGRQAIESVNSQEMAVAGKLSWRSIIVDILAVLPVPQVLLVGVFFKMIGPGYLENRKALNFVLVAQYLPRIYRVHLSSFTTFHKLEYGPKEHSIFSFTSLQVM